MRDLHRKFINNARPSRAARKASFIDSKSFDEHITVGANLISAHSPALGAEHEIALKVGDASAAVILQLAARALQRPPCFEG
jgi:hypothetical protein